MLLSVKALRSMILLVVAGAGSGCAAWNGTRPYDMSVAEHERAASGERAKAAAAAEAARAGGRGAEWERAESRRYEVLAGEHADAAQKLEQEVRAACPSGPDRFPAALSELRVVKVDAIRDADVPPEGRLSGRGYSPKRLRGARLVVAGDGVGRDALTQASRCANIQALAGVTPQGSGSSPFAVRGAEVSVRDRELGASVEIRADDPAVASEILRRAEALQRSAPTAR